MSESDWVCVTKKYKPKRSSSKANSVIINDNLEDCLIFGLVGRVGMLLRENEFVKSILNDLKIKLMDKCKQNNHIFVLLGLTFTCLLRELILEICPLAKQYYFDPSLSKSEHDMMNMLGFICLQDNKRGCYDLSLLYSADNVGSSEPPLYLCYMPHCPYQLYCNLLWANWASLSQLVIIGNSFVSYLERRSLEVHRADCSDVITLLHTATHEYEVWRVSSKKAMKEVDGYVSGRSVTLTTSGKEVSDLFKLQWLPEGLRDKCVTSVTTGYLITVLSAFESAFCDTSVMWFSESELARPAEDVMLRCTDNDIEIK